MLIKRQAVHEFLTRDFDSFLWMKKLNEDMILRELRAMRNRPYFKTKPWLHQLVCFYIGLYHPHFLFLLDMGLGKTKVILDLITQRQRERRLDRALVFVPSMINMDSWKDDILLHSHLEPNPVNVSDIDEKWERLIRPQGDVTVIDYAGLHLALSVKKKTSKGKVLKPDEKKVELIRRMYNFIAIDESHKLANHQSLWFQLVRRLTETAEFTYATTGTLFGRDLEDIWPQFYLVDGGETFGENLGLFRASFFTAKPNPWGRGEKFEYDPRQDRKLNQMLQHRSLRYDETEVLDLPERVSVAQQYVMTPEQREHYLNALEGFINAYGNMQEQDGQWVRMRRICSGYLQWKDERGDHVIRFKENPKLDGLQQMIEDMGPRAKMVVAYDYTETGRMIVDRVKSMGIDCEWFYGGTKDKTGSRDRFMRDPKCRVFVMNSSAGGTGNDGLQKVARYLALYETPTSPVERQQVIKRVHRPGQNMRCFVYDLVMRQSLDPGILADIAANRDTYDSVVNGKRKPGKGFFLQDLPGT